MSGTVSKPEQNAAPDFRIRVRGFVKVSQNAFYFSKMGEPVQLRPEQMLAVPGSYPRYCYFVQSGQVIAGTSDTAGNKRILLSFEENTLLLEQYLLTGKPCDLYYKAVERTTARMISYHDLTQAMKTDFSVTLDVINAISELGALAHQRQRSENEHSARQKVCDQLLDFALVYGVQAEGRVRIEEKVTHERIGLLTGLHRITVTREIKRLREQGILSQEEGLYVISSLEELVRYRDAAGNKTKEKP